MGPIRPEPAIDHSRIQAEPRLARVKDAATRCSVRLCNYPQKGQCSGPKPDRCKILAAVRQSRKSYSYGHNSPSHPCRTHRRFLPTSGEIWASHQSAVYQNPAGTHGALSEYRNGMSVAISHRGASQSGTGFHCLSGGFTQSFS